VNKKEMVFMKVIFTSFTGKKCDLISWELKATVDPKSGFLNKTKRTKS